MKQCPYCLKGVSEFAIQCPYCNRDLNNGNIDYSAILAKSIEMRDERRARGFKQIGIFMIVLICIFLVVNTVRPWFFEIYSKSQISKAKQLLKEGEYQFAYNILKPIQKNSNAEELLTEIVNESYILSAREAAIEGIKSDNEGNSLHPLQDGEWDYILEESTFFRNYEFEYIPNVSTDYFCPAVVLKLCVQNVETGKPYGTYYSFCVYEQTSGKYISLGVCLYSQYGSYRVENPRATDAKSACRIIVGYEPQNEPIEIKYDSARLLRMCSSKKKIAVLK